MASSQRDRGRKLTGAAVGPQDKEMHLIINMTMKGSFRVQE